MNTRKVLIEMEVPDDLDDSEILARLQELAVEWAEEFHDEDEDGDLDSAAFEDAVSVQTVSNEKAEAA